MTAKQQRLILNILRTAAGLGLVWILSLAGVTAWERWQASTPVPYKAALTTTERTVLMVREASGTLATGSRAAAFWGPLVLTIGAFWTRRFLLAGDGGGEAHSSEAEADHE